MSGFEPTDTSFKGQLINHWATITGNKSRLPEHYHTYAHVLWKYASVVRAVSEKIALGAIRNCRCVTVYIVRTPKACYMHRHYRTSWKRFFCVRLTPDARRPHAVWPYLTYLKGTFTQGAGVGRCIKIVFDYLYRVFTHSTSAVCVRCKRLWSGIYE